MSPVPSPAEAIVEDPSSLQEKRAPTVLRSNTISRVRRRFTFGQKADSAGKSQAPDKEIPFDDLRKAPKTAPTARAASIWASSSINRLLYGENVDSETYGLNEDREGFFDALFLNPRALNHEHLATRAKETLPDALQAKDRWSFVSFLRDQWNGIKLVARAVATTRAGVKLSKSFLPVFIAYVLCLVPDIRTRLGRYSYVMVVSTVINHSGRTLGAQIDGCVFTIFGTITGLGWGSVALWLSTCTPQARVGYGAILATFLSFYVGAIAAMRAYLIRFYQFVICAGIAIFYMCLSEVSESSVEWAKLLEYGIPWAVGQGLCLLVGIIFLPDAGARPLAVAFNDAFAAMLNGLDDMQANIKDTRRELAQTFVNLSQAYRDLAIDFTITLFDPEDVRILRNSLQAVVRALLALRPKPQLFVLRDVVNDLGLQRARELSTFQDQPNSVPRGLRKPGDIIRSAHQDNDMRAARLVRLRLENPTSLLFQCMKQSLRSCHAVLMDMSGYRKHLGPFEDVDTQITGILEELRKAMSKFDSAEADLLEDDGLTSTFIPEVVEIFAYCHPIRQAATTIEAVLVKVKDTEHRKPSRQRIHPPSYPWRKSLNRTNAQVRHDRGGLTAASYFRSFASIRRMVERITSIDYMPLLNGGDLPNLFPVSHQVPGQDQERGEQADNETKLKKSIYRHNVWKTAHRMQGFEMRFALKTVIVTSLLSLPAWINESRGWWNLYEAWWAVIMAWVMMHPRVGGNLQDLFTRVLAGIFGAVWGGATYAASNGNPYGLAGFAAPYYLLALYRFTQTDHPRSGLVGCLSFTVTSLALVTDHGQTSTPLIITVSRGLAFTVGVIASVVINWFIWPFVARHELRKSCSSMLYFLSMVYSSVLGKYIYYDPGRKPTAEDIERSETLEGRLREGFVRIGQLLELTRHEIRLRAPFDPLPYSGLVSSCEQFFEYLVAVRQAALFWAPKFVRDNDEAVEKLLHYRRDAVATVLINLYTLAGALRANRKVPKYLPNAAASRKRLMEQVIELEKQFKDNEDKSAPKQRKRWAQVYNYSYNESLTGCVEQLEELEQYTKMILGEQGLDNYSDSDLSDEESK